MARLAFRAVVSYSGSPSYTSVTYTVPVGATAVFIANLYGYTYTSTNTVQGAPIGPIVTGTLYTGNPGLFIAGVYTGGFQPGQGSMKPLTANAGDVISANVGGGPTPAAFCIVGFLYS